MKLNEKDLKKDKVIIIQNHQSFYIFYIFEVLRINYNNLYSLHVQL